MSTQLKVSRRQVITALIDMLEAGIPVEKVAKILAAYLVEYRQTRNLELYLRDFELAIAQRLGVVTTYVTSARKLSQKTRERVRQLVKDTTGAKEIELIETEDPALIGGIIIRTADAELDGSMRTKLRNLRSI